MLGFTPSAPDSTTSGSLLLAQASVRCELLVSAVDVTSWASTSSLQSPSRADTAALVSSLARLELASPLPDVAHPEPLPLVQSLS